MAQRQQEEDLHKRAQQGDTSACRELLDGFRTDLERYIATRLGDHLRHRVELDDVVQETYAQALKSLPDMRWQGRPAFFGWLRSVALHIILNLARRARSSPVLYVEAEAATRDASPSRVMARGERRTRLVAALALLKPDYRDAIRMVRLEGLTMDEAGRRMGRTPKAVSHLVLRGLRELRRIFGDTESLTLPHEIFDEAADGTSGSNGS